MMVPSCSIYAPFLFIFTMNLIPATEQQSGEHEWRTDRFTENANSAVCWDKWHQAIILLLASQNVASWLFQIYPGEVGAKKL